VSLYADLCLSKLHINRDYKDFSGAKLPIDQLINQEGQLF